MDVVLLSRIQFGLNAGFHFLFAPLSIGLTLVILLVEGIHVGTGDDRYRKLSAFLVRIMGLTFVIGVATGIVLEFSFGTNWSRYSRMVGDIFGAPLAAEAILSFFLESVFLGVLLFGRNRVSKRTYLLSAFLLFLGSHLSGLWIIIANSWMQTPAGYSIVGGRAVLTDFVAAALNHSTLIRFFHVILAAWLTGLLFSAGVAAWYLLRRRDEDLFLPLMKLVLPLFLALAFVQLSSGHLHSVRVAETQPAKLAAFEALWQGETRAGLSLFGIPDEATKTTRFEVKIPALLSYLIHFDANARVPGLADFPADETPPVLIPFLTYHVMIGLGSLFILIGLVGGLLLASGRLAGSRWYLWSLLLAIPLPSLANEAGWIAAEVGRQPWVVFKLLRTADAATFIVPPGQILFSLILFGAIYLLLFVMFIKLLTKLITRGPDDASHGY